LGCLGVELARRGPLDPGLVAGVLDDHALQSEAEAQGGDPLLACEAQRAQLALDTANAESTGNADAVDIGERGGRALRRLARVGRDPADLDLRLLREAARLEGLRDREVGVGQVDVLSDE